MDKKLAGILKMAGVEVPANSVFLRHGHLIKDCVGWNGRQVLLYQTHLLPEGADLKNAVLVAHGASLGRYSELFGVDEGEASGDINDESKLHGTNSTTNSDHGYRT